MDQKVEACGGLFSLFLHFFKFLFSHYMYIGIHLTTLPLTENVFNPPSEYHYIAI